MHRVDSDLDFSLLDRRINSLESELRNLKHERNSKVPISRLPQEILLRIFFELSRESKPFFEEWWDWLIVTKICSYWRNAALGYSALWTEIYRFSRPDKIKAFLERSGRVVIEVHIIAKTDQTSDILTCLEEHIQRIRRLSLDLDSAFGAWDELRSLFKKLTRRTRILSLCNTETARCLQAPRNWDQPEVHSTARLYKLDLSGIRMPTTCWLFDRLSELSLQDIHADYRPSISDLLRILRRCPNLQRLNLERIGPSPFSQASEVSCVHLPRLYYIRLSGIDFGTSLLLLRSLKIPKGPEWYIHCVNVSFDEPQVFDPEYLIEGGTNGILNITFHNNSLDISADQDCDPDYDNESASGGLYLTSSRREAFSTLNLPLNALIINLSHPYWKNITYFDIDFYNVRDLELLEEMNTRFFSRLLDILPRNTKDLFFCLPAEKEIDLIHALVNSNLTTDEENVRFPELRRFTLYDPTFPGIEGRKAYKLLKLHLEMIGSGRRSGGCKLNLDTIVGNIIVEPEDIEV